MFNTWDHGQISNLIKFGPNWKFQISYWNLKNFLNESCESHQTNHFSCSPLLLIQSGRVRFWQTSLNSKFKFESKSAEMVFWPKLKNFQQNFKICQKKSCESSLFEQLSCFELKPILSGSGSNSKRGVWNPRNLNSNSGSNTWNWFESSYPGHVPRHNKHLLCSNFSEISSKFWRNACCHFRELVASSHVSARRASRTRAPLTTASSGSAL